MNGMLRVVLGVVVLSYFVLIFHFLKKKTLLLKYTLLWIAAGMVMGLLVLVPQLLDWFVHLIGIQTPMNGLLVVSVLAILIILMSLTAIVSKQAERMKRLTQYISFLEKRVREQDKENSG